MGVGLLQGSQLLETSTCWLRLHRKPPMPTCINSILIFRMVLSSISFVLSEVSCAPVWYELVTMVTMTRTNNDSST